MFVVERDEREASKELLLTLIKDWDLFISFVLEREVILKVDADANLIKFTVQNLFFASTVSVTFQQPICLTSSTICSI